MRWTRFLLESLAFSLGLVLSAAVGFTSAGPLALWLAEQAGLDQVLMSQPTELAALSWELAAACPWVLAWLLDLTCRLWLRRAPTPLELTAMLLGPLSIALLGSAQAAFGIISATQAANGLGIAPMVGLDALSLAGPATTWAFFGAVLSGLAIFVRARRSTMAA